MLARTQKSSPDTRLQDALARHDWPGLEQACRRALRKNGRQLQAHRLLGFALHRQGRSEDAVEAYRKATAYWPRDAELLVNFANILQERGLHAEAAPLLRTVCELRPHEARWWIKFAQSCYETQQHEPGYAAAEKACALATTLADQVAALNQRAIHRRELGQVREAVQDCETAIGLAPHDVANHTNRLLFMLADPTTREAELAQAARQFASIFETPLKPEWPDFADQRQGPWRRLRVGFLSPDFRTHSVMYFVEGILAQLDRRQFDVYAFYLHPGEDAITERVKRHADHFIKLAGLPVREQVRRIREEKIDLLIDLAGHTGHNGLLAMAHKAAPIQATWVGFPGTTGLSAVDYLITDAETDPPGVEPFYSERLFRLPNARLCVYRPMSRHPLWRYQPRYLVRETPALRNGYVTFGSCNNLGKLTDEVLTTWGEILRAVPDSRLLIEGKNFDKADFAEGYRERCARLGIDPQRLELVPLDPSNQYLTYHRIDVALDPYPLNGGTTSMDVLWMGVPLVAMEGNSFKSRITTGILRYLGRSEWLGRTRDDYVRIASTLASDQAALNTIRLGLRKKVENSILMREDRFNLIFADALRTMWQTWLAQDECADDVDAQSALIASWQEDKPAAWNSEPVPGVGLSPGVRLPLHEVHDKLMTLVEQCKAQAPKVTNTSGNIENPQWAELTRLAETVLTAIPHDPVALACLAEVEFAHGHADFAVTYLRYAQDALATQATEAARSSP